MEKVIDLYECVDDYGNAAYIDEFSYFDILEEKRDKLFKFLDDIEKNNPCKDIDLNSPISDIEKTIPKKILISEEKVESIKQNKFIKKIRNVACIATLVIGFLAFGSKVGEKNIDLSCSNNYSITDDSETSKTISLNKKVNIKKTAKTKRKVRNLKLGSNIKLDNVKLKYTSLEGKPVVNTDKLSYDSYKVNSVSIVQNNEVKEVVKPKKSSTFSKLISKFRSKYGSDIDIEVNVDGYVDGKLECKNVGWTSISNIKNKSMVKRK